MGRAALLGLVGCALSCAPRPSLSPPRTPHAPPVAATPRGVVELASGADFFCARFASGKVACYQARNGAIDLRTPRLLDVADAKRILVVVGRVWVQHADAKWSSIAVDSSYVDSPVEPRSGSPLMANGVACAREAGGAVACMFASEPKDAPVRVMFPDAKGARELVVVRQKQEPWLCGRTANHDLSCWSMSGKTAKAASSVSRVWGGERLCMQQVNGLLSCLRDDASLDVKLAWDPIRRYPQLEAVATGLGIGCAAIDDRHVECWWWEQHWDDHVDAGMTYAGELRGEPKPVPSLDHVVSLSAGGAHACALEASGRVSCWGRVGPVASSAAAPVARLPFTGAVAVAIGGEHACAIQNRRAWCWGDNRFGQLGQSKNVKAAPTPIDVGAVDELALGDRHTCVRTHRGAVYCYGDPADGRLGRKAGQSPFVSRVSGIEGAKKLAASGDLTCVIDARASVWCWGKLDGKHGSAGPVAIPELSGASDVSIDRRFVCALIGGSVRCKERSTKEVRTAYKKGVVQLSGRCVRMEDHRVQCFDWQRHESGEPELGEVLFASDVGVRGATEIWLGPQGGCARLVDGSTRCFRSPEPGPVQAEDVSPIPSGAPLAFPSTLKRLVDVAIARNLVCAVDEDEHVWCAGSLEPPSPDPGPAPPWRQRPIPVTLPKW